MKKKLALFLLALLICIISICVLVWGILPVGRVRIKQPLPPVVFPTPTRVELSLPTGWL